MPMGAYTKGPAHLPWIAQWRPSVGFVLLWRMFASPCHPSRAYCRAMVGAGAGLTNQRCGCYYFKDLGSVSVNITMISNSDLRMTVQHPGILYRLGVGREYSGKGMPGLAWKGISTLRCLSTLEHGPSTVLACTQGTGIGQGMDRVSHGGNMPDWQVQVVMAGLGRCQVFVKAVCKGLTVGKGLILA